VICLNGDRQHECQSGALAFGRKPVDLSQHCRMEWADELREMLSSTSDLQ
jgi:hypothetical protein